MQHHNHQQQSRSNEDSNAMFDVLFGLVESVALTATVFTRYGFGAEAFGVKGVLTFVGLLFYADGFQSIVLTQFLVIWFAAVILQRFLTFRQSYLGNDVHSRWCGTPWLWHIAPFIKNYRQARTMEIFLVFFTGVMLCPISVPLGQLWQYAAGALLVLELLDRVLLEKERRRLNDGMIEMRRRGELISDIERR